MPSDLNAARAPAGPLLRHVDPVSATVWVETDRACEVDVLGRRARTFCVGGHHYALVVVEDLEPGSTHALRGAPGRRRRSGPRSSRRSRRAASGRRATRARSASRSAPAGTRRPATADDRGRHPAGRPGLLRRTRRGPAGGPVARRARAARRPGLRRRADPADALAGWPCRRGDGRPAGRPGDGLRGVHPALRGVLERSAGPVAAVDGPVVDDLRRPRDDRRLEHLGGLAAGDHRPAVVEGPDQRRPGQLLGLPAPGQPQPAGAGREHDLAGDPGPRTRTPTTPSRSCARWPRRPTPTRRASGGASCGTGATRG